jgi:hypothetical protein
MAPFGSDVVAATLKLYPHKMDPEFQYTSLSSDIGVNCPNSLISRQMAKNWNASFYRYVVTAK